MQFGQNIGKFLIFFLLGGCATVPAGPSVMVLPTTGKSFEAFNTEDATCRRWAEQGIGAASSQVAEQNTVKGAVAGTAIGTGLGAVLGSASGNAGAGALIGAVSGLFIGSASGASSGEAYGWEAQRRYDNAYLQCMYSYGNQLPGSGTRAARPVAVPPPETYSAPEAVYLDDAPQFVYSADLGFYVAVGVPYDLVYNGSEYFYFNRGRWYRSPFYNGPWRYIGRRAYSSPMFRFKIDNIHYYRDVEYRRFEHDRDHYAGRIYRPDYRGERRRADHR